MSQMKIAIQGQDGSFHAAVARQWYKDSCELVPCATFSDVFSAYNNGEADAIVVAVENTTYGSINEVYQLVEDCELPIIGEVALPIDQQLIAGQNASLESITEVYSHPVALAQCREFIEKNLPNAETIEYFDTAGAVEYIKSLDSPNVAAIASKDASELHMMPIIVSNIQDSKNNITRFLILEDRDSDPSSNRASLLVTTSHKPGALVEVLQEFAKENINLAKLQSQPIQNKPWNYKFFMVVDCAGEKLRNVVAKIEKTDHEVTLLGEYIHDSSTD